MSVHADFAALSGSPRFTAECGAPGWFGEFYSKAKTSDQKAKVLEMRMTMKCSSAEPDHK